MIKNKAYNFCFVCLDKVLEVLNINKLQLYLFNIIRKS